MTTSSSTRTDETDDVPATGPESRAPAGAGHAPTSPLSGRPLGQSIPVSPAVTGLARPVPAYVNGSTPPRASVSAAVSAPARTCSPRRPAARPRSRTPRASAGRSRRPPTWPTRSRRCTPRSARPSSPAGWASAPPGCAPSAARPARPDAQPPPATNQHHSTTSEGAPRAPLFRGRPFRQIGRRPGSCRSGLLAAARTRREPTSTRWARVAGSHRAPATPAANASAALTPSDSATAYSLARSVPNIAGSSVLIVQRTPAARRRRQRVLDQGVDDPGPEVRGRTDVEHQTPLDDLGQHVGVLDGPNAVAQAVRIHGEDLADRRRARRPRRRAGRCRARRRGRSRTPCRYGSAGWFSAPPRPRPTTPRSA